MWAKALKMCSILAFHVLITSLANAETIDLRTGKIIVGEVSLIGEEKIVIEAIFPEIKTVSFKYDELTPISLYNVLERRIDPKNSKERLKLGEFAEESHLNGIAIAEYTAVKRLDESQEKEMDRRIAHLQEAIAKEILNDAKDMLEEKNHNGALMYLHTILEQYQKTDVSKEAKKLINRAHKQAGMSAVVSHKTVTVGKAPKVIDEIKKYLEKGDKWLKTVGGHENSSTHDQRSAEKAVKYYERAWTSTKTLPVTSDDEQLRTLIQDLRIRVKKDLVKAYLTTGTIYLQRGSIPSAERYCNKACELEPENKENHLLHKLIIEAKIYQSSGGRR